MMEDPGIFTYSFGTLCHLINMSQAKYPQILFQKNVSSNLISLHYAWLIIKTVNGAQILISTPSAIVCFVELVESLILLSLNLTLQ